MIEAAIQKAIVDYLRSIGAWYFAFSKSIRKKRRVPNIIYHHKGRFIGLEVKTARGRPSTTKKAKLRRINAAKGRTMVVRSVEDVKDIINTLEGGKLSDDSSGLDDDTPDG